MKSGLVTFSAALGALAAACGCMPAHAQGYERYRSLYSFMGGEDGASPIGVVSIHGTLYGATSYGGGSGCFQQGCGTIYSLSTTGSESVIAALDGATPLYRPTAPIAAHSGALIGTAGFGGDTTHCAYYGCGGVYSVTTSGAVATLASFAGGKQPAAPQSSLTPAASVFLGTSTTGGSRSSACSSGCGTIYSVSRTGKIRVLHRFDGTDGATPMSGLLDVNGTFFGVTSGGGTGTGGVCFGGCGVLYSITRDGTYTVLHDFAGDTDGAEPAASLVYVDGMIVGTAFNGGARSYGTVFRVAPDGTGFTVMHSFQGNAAGGFPSGGVTQVGAYLYGATILGGANAGGVIYRLDPSTGAYKIVYSFGSSSDGVNPNSDLALAAGTLYGTTENGGVAGHGTVFAYTP